TLKRQSETLNSLRNRAAAVLSVAALVISVGGGIGLVNAGASRAGLPRWAEFCLMAVVGVIGVLVIAVQCAVSREGYGLSHGRVYELSRDRDEDALRRKLVLLMADSVKKNEGILVKRSRYFQIATALLVAEVFIFALAITISRKG